MCVESSRDADAQMEVEWEESENRDRDLFCLYQSLVNHEKLTPTPHDTSGHLFPQIIFPLFRSMKWKVVDDVAALTETQTTNIVNSWLRYTKKQEEEELETMQRTAFIRFALPSQMND
jgi:hypothetical protein